LLPLPARPPGAGPRSRALGQPPEGSRPVASSSCVRNRLVR
jgi:hypothetical protein